MYFCLAKIKLSTIVWLHIYLFNLSSLFMSFNYFSLAIFFLLTDFSHIIYSNPGLIFGFLLPKTDEYAHFIIFLSYSLASFIFPLPLWLLVRILSIFHLYFSQNVLSISLSTSFFLVFVNLQLANFLNFTFI